MTNFEKFCGHKLLQITNFENFSEHKSFFAESFAESKTAKPQNFFSTKMSYFNEVMKKLLTKRY